MKYYQKGFTLVETLLIILVVSFIGFAGWYVYDANKDKPTDESTSETKKSPKTDSDSDQVPDGYVVFKSKVVGTTFAYPKEWGNANLSEGPESSHLIKGSEYEIEFSGNANVTAGFSSKDREHDPEKGHGGMLYAGAYVNSQFSYADVKAYVSVTEHQNTASTTLFSGPLMSLGCEGVGTVLIQKIEGNTTYGSIAFLYFDKKIDFNKPDDTLCDNYKNYISQANVDVLKKLAQQ